MNDQKIILIVEDEEPMLEALVQKISGAGFQTREAKNGEEALELALNEHPDLILLDVIIPKLDGVMVMTKLRSDTWGKTVPIILLTNLEADSKMMWKIVENEPSYYLVKSNIKLDDVITKIKEALKM